MRLKKILLSFILPFVLCHVHEVEAQNSSSNGNPILGYYNKVAGQVNRYREEVNRMYGRLLGGEWTKARDEDRVEFTLREDEPIPIVVYDPEYDKCDYRIEVKPHAVLHPQKVGARPDHGLIRFEETAELKDIQYEVMLNGYDIALRFVENGKIKIADSSVNSIAAAWNELSAKPYTNMFRDLSKARDFLNLCDWSFVCLVNEFTKSVYGASSVSEAVLTQAFILNSFGYKVMLARNSDGTIFKFLASTQKVLNRPGIRVDGDKYYVFDNVVPRNYSFFEFDLNGERALWLGMPSEESYFETFTATRTFSSARYPNVSFDIKNELSKLSFYASYPVVCPGDDVLNAFAFYADVPLSLEIQEKVFRKLSDILQGRGELEAVNIIMNFVQTAFKYDEDEDFWGVERYFFADELWHYGACDCEDKAILLSRLVRDLLGLETAIVYWPGHASCAVRFSSKVNGYHFVVDGVEYTSCDPTFVNAGVGAMMDEVKELPATLILL